MEAKLKEKNKRAQKRFRDRQKSRLQESERQVSDLSARLNALLVDHNRLASRNSILEKVVALRQDSSTGTSIAPQDKGVPEPFIPGKPWNPAALLTISVRGQPFTLTAQQVRDMPVQEHAKLWKEYVDELGAQLLHTHGSKGATAVARVGQLVSELTRICACKAAYAPHHLQSLHMHTLDGSVQNVPGREVWSGILHTLHLTADQRKQLLDARQCYVDAMAHVVHTRQEIAAALQAAKSSGRSTHEVGVGFVRTHDLLQRLADNQREDQAASMQLMAAVWRHIWTPMQAAAALVQSFPWAPDVLEMLHALAAEEDGLSQGALPAAPAHIDHAPLAGSCQAGSGRGSSTSGRDEAPLGIIASFGA
ncbi:hypothetical protein WJX72_005894 [[Myrmecia] bisecta]|uniref:BZIP domain-containing protein n=1 Tax=[Myrmecia] bisecta TaxID=41462 RepID=A0AAW1R7W5_9CHLO